MISTRFVESTALSVWLLLGPTHTLTLSGASRWSFFH